MKQPRAVEVALGSLHLSSGDVEEWLRPLQRREIRRDLRKYAAHPRRGRRDLLAATDALPSFERPVLVVWASEDRLMPPEHGRRLAELFPNSRHLEIPDGYTLVPIDQPATLAAHLRQFIGDLEEHRCVRVVFAGFAAWGLLG
jgi:pimeloyl-ACP methyl ester carboxylesterase